VIPFVKPSLSDPPLIPEPKARALDPTRSPGDAAHVGDLAHALMRHAADLFLVLNDDGTIRYASASAERVLGYAPEWLHGNTPASLIHPDDATALAAFLAALFVADGDRSPLVVRLHHGSVGWRQFELSPLDLRNEPIVGGLVLSLRDITTRLQSERQSAAFLELGQQLGAATSAEAAARIIARVSDELLGWDAYYLSLYSTEDDLLTSVLSVDLIAGQRTEIPEADGAWGQPGTLSRQVIDTGGKRILRHNSPGDIAPLDPFGDQERLSASLIYVPIRADETVVGILSIQSYTEDAYTHADMVLLQSLADHCGGALERVRAEAALRASEARLRHQATHDTLTGLPNRALFNDRLARALESPAAPGKVVAVIFIDLDRFKVVNDSLGHEAGDLLLVLAAARLRTVLRATDTAARLGGDEFTVLLEGIAGAEDAARVAARIVELFTDAFAIGQHHVVISASIGIALGVARDDQPTELLRRADIALYSAKNGGRSRYAIFDEAMSDAAVERMELEAELRRAIECEDLQLHYQPLTDLLTGRVVAVEALVRWPRGTHSLIGPERFVPVAEESGLILPLGRWVLQEACRQVCAWRARGLHPDLKVNVNLSAAEFAQPGLAEAIAQTLQETGLDAAALELEITESVIMADASATSATLHELKRLGVRLAIDDFGTGYSSLSYLKRFPVDTLKIDKAFVDGLGHDPDDEAIVGAMIGIGQALGLQLVAEGIETVVQMARLQELGCTLGQGYHFAPPGPPAVVEQLLLPR
jgi:diguanylate cyclase (GGDEF)-like protein/PAS domain S-box-containing protein